MTEQEMKFLDALLKSLENQRILLDESIISIKKVLEYENSIQISMPKGEGEKT